MVRPSRWTLAAAFFLSAAAAGGVARADGDDDLKSLTSDCGAKVETSDINGCLERAREIAESSPSPYLQSLMARLERQAEAADSGGGRHQHSLSKDDAADPASANAQRPSYAEASSTDWDDEKLNSDMDLSNLGPSDPSPHEIEMDDDQKAPAEPEPHS